MSIIPDMSDEGIRRQFGDIVLEIPELFEALRRFELENRPTVTSDGLRMDADWLSVSGGGLETRIRVGDARREKEFPESR